MDFNNTELAFRSKSAADLRRSYLLFSALNHQWLVKLGELLVRLSFFLRLPIKGIIKKTVYKQFVGGETIADCTLTVRHLLQYRIESILDYSVEGKIRETDFDRTTELTLQTMAAHSKYPHLHLAAFKCTGLARLELLEKMSRGDLLNSSESDEWDRAVARMQRLAKYAKKEGCGLMIDAEETWIQPAIDQAVNQLMREFNTESCVIFTTVQLYRTGRIEVLQKELDDAKAGGYLLGVKIVRGAYMEKERERALKEGYPSPIQPDKQATDRDFDRAIHLLTEGLGTPQTPTGNALVIGTHNELSTQAGVDALEAHGWTPGHAPVWFSQLYGMSDHISYIVASHGHRVAKYLPFGPVQEVMPYLFRRAEENTSVAGQTGRELRLIQQERQRRKKAH